MYGGLTEKNIFKLQKLQNNAVRFIFRLHGKKKHDAIMPYLKKLHFLPVRYRIQFKVALLVFKCLNDLAPGYLTNMLSTRDIKRRSSRLDDDFYLLKTLPAPRFTKTEAAFSYYGPKVWNVLPYSIRCITNIEQFKKCLKSYYFNIAFEGIQ